MRSSSIGRIVAGGRFPGAVQVGFDPRGEQGGAKDAAAKPVGGLGEAAEKIRGEAWVEWSERHGDWGTGRSDVRGSASCRAAVGGPQVGMKYQAAAQAVKRYGQALVNDPARKRFVARLRHALSTI